MQLGSDLYDLAPSYGTTLARPTDPPPKNPLPTDAPGASTTFLAMPSDQAQILVTENNVAGHISLVPASSSSKTHIELVKHVGQQHVKHSRMKVLLDVVDPENAHVAQTSAKKRTTRGAGGGQNRSQRKKRDSSDEEDSRYTFDTDMPGRGSRAGANKVIETEYDEDDGFVVADTDEEDEGDEDEEGDDEAAYGSTKKSKKKAKSKKRKGTEELDEMEEMEKRIEASEREKKRAKRDKKEKSRRRDYDSDEEDEPAQPVEADAEGEEDMDMDMDEGSD